MKPIIVPTTDVNSETGVLIAWHVDSGERAAAGEILAEIETSKAVIEVPLPEDGFVLHFFEEGAELPLTEPIAGLFDDQAALQAHAEERAQQAEAARTAAQTKGVRATAKAQKRAQELGVDLSTLDASRLITVKEVEAAHAAQAPVDYSAFPSPLPAEAGVQRVLLIGGGRGATQVIDIFGEDERQAPVCILDDKRERWGELVEGVPIVGGTDRLAELHAAGQFDTAIVAISTSVDARRKFREACAKAGVPMANAIDPTVRMCSGVTIGTGNVICAYCHFGVDTEIGDNNFISAYNSYDHHNVLGSDISTGPGCMTSGRVKLRDRVRMGTGIFIEPGMELGENVRVASGAIVLTSVPANHAVKTKVLTTAIVPNR